jgi:hypothetical protein
VKALIFIVVLFLASCDSDSDSVYTGNNLIISTVDINGDAYPITEVIWRYESDPEVSHTLECDTDVCDTWEFPLKVEGNVLISGYNSVQFDNDEFCAELFHGQRSLNVKADIPQELSIEIIYDGAVCS